MWYDKPLKAVRMEIPSILLEKIRYGILTLAVNDTWYRSKVREYATQADWSYVLLIPFKSDTI